jgi:hypothetical protein
LFKQQFLMYVIMSYVNLVSYDIHIEILI